MAMRPIEIARKLDVSTPTLRKYQDFGLIPSVSRSASGYRVFTEEHLAYFICIREMLAGFGLIRISAILKLVMAKKFDAALWIANRVQADLHQEKLISEKIMSNLILKNDLPFGSKHEQLTINEVSRETGVPATTIRYWDKLGLISVARGAENNYRMFTPNHIRQILTIYALKLSVYSKNRKYSVDRVKRELKEFDYDDRNRMVRIANDIKQHLDQVNRSQIRGIAALYHLCMQVERNQYDNQLTTFPDLDNPISASLGKNT